MTDPVIIISGTAVVGESRDEKRERQEKGRRCGTAGRLTGAGSDSVDISEEARERASGRKRKSILEYLEE